MRIDSHQHFWQYDPARHDWIDESMSAIRRDFSPSDLDPLLRDHQLDGSVVVQVDQTEAETESLLQIASQHDFIKGVVGWVDLRAESLESRLEYYSQFGQLKGFRHIVQSEPDDFMVQPDFMEGISKLRAFDFCYDILIFPTQLEAAEILVEKYPDQKFVVDHIAKPYVKDQLIDGWSEGIKRLGQHSHVFCKISGLVTEAKWDSWSRKDFYPYLDVVVDAFGPNRIMYGSDWPVCTLAATYDQVYQLADSYFQSFSDHERALFFGENCSDFYGLQN